LDEDEKADVTISYTSSNGTVQNRKVKAINESGFYKLIFKSTKPEAKVFQKWVTSEVLPSLRKSGFYGNAKKLTDFIDARDVPYTQVLFNETPVRTITLKEIPYYSLNDYHAAIKSRTESSQAAKKLNKVQPLAVKIWLFGNTHPAWFTTLQGLQLIASGSRVFNSSNQLVLSL
jgi:prophage antirepressor-like protein